MEQRRPYDKFKQAVYKAEDSLLNTSHGFGRTFETLSDVLEWVATIHSVDPLFRGAKHVVVLPAHGNAKASWASFEENAIVLNEEGMNEQIILHELAHLLTGKEIVFHGSEFCWNYLDLTLRWRGKEVYFELRDALRSTGVFG